jgi:hypothetical protein
MEGVCAADLVEVGRLTDQRRPVCEADNLWRGNDITRGLWPVDNPDWAEDDNAGTKQQRKSSLSS